MFSDFNNFTLKAKGTGTLEVIFIKANTENWEEQPKATINLTENLEEYEVPLSDFTNTNIFNDVVTIVFKMISETRETVTKKVTIKDVRFSKSSSLSTDIKPIYEHKMIAIPNPMTTTAEIHFTTNTTEALTLEIYNQLGKKVFTTPCNSNIGENKIMINKDNLSSGLYFCKLKSNQKHYNILKLIVN